MKNIAMGVLFSILNGLLILIGALYFKDLTNLWMLLIACVAASLVIIAYELLYDKIALKLKILKLKKTPAIYSSPMTIDATYEILKSVCDDKPIVLQSEIPIPSFRIPPGSTPESVADIVKMYCDNWLIENTSRTYKIRQEPNELFIGNQ